MDIRSALANLIVIQAGLSITSPITESIEIAYTSVPDQSVQLPDVPAWTNDWTLVSVERNVAFRILNFTINSQLYVKDANLSRGFDIATAFLDKYITALDADISLGQTITQHSLRGGNPTMVSLSRSNQTYQGLNLFMDIEMKEAKDFT